MVDLNRRNLKLLPQKAIAKVINNFQRTVMPGVCELQARVRGNRVSAFWWTGARNFGDLLTPALLRHYGLTPVYCSDPARAEVAATGSIIGMLPVDFKGFVLGSGLLSDNKTLRLPEARILALRGALTKDRLAVTEDVILGDPGILCADLMTRRSQSKKYVLGLVPHYEERDHEFVESLRRQYPKEVVIINVQRSPRAVIRDIDECEHILSSSLHGLIAADTLGVPNGWMHLSDRVIGKGFKFRDYYSAFGIEREPIDQLLGMSLIRLVDQTAQPCPALFERQDLLRKAFVQLTSKMYAESH